MWVYVHHTPCRESPPKPLLHRGTGSARGPLGDRANGARQRGYTHPPLATQTQRLRFHHACLRDDSRIDHHLAQMNRIQMGKRQWHCQVCQTVMTGLEKREHRCGGEGRRETANNVQNPPQHNNNNRRTPSLYQPRARRGG
ncbi:hypothetical protein ElyMa_006849800 [Elysia marginata]|uniref:Uncharacterized protein n=1 Tax=Elysia marginata TaxID=1093978 RepID=A0AAV4J6U0_9GAST|nr:hypothetical protein ElyMa_006849800 [Elysia marginata]